MLARIICSETYTNNPFGPYWLEGTQGVGKTTKVQLFSHVMNKVGNSENTSNKNLYFINEPKNYNLSGTSFTLKVVLYLGLK